MCTICAAYLCDAKEVSGVDIRKDGECFARGARRPRKPLVVNFNVGTLSRSAHGPEPTRFFRIRRIRTRDGSGEFVVVAIRRNSPQRLETFFLARQHRGERARCVTAPPGASFPCGGKEVRSFRHDKNFQDGHKEKREKYDECALTMKAAAATRATFFDSVLFFLFFCARTMDTSRGCALKPPAAPTPSS